MPLRRLRALLEPLRITTAPAPVLGGPHVDVTADPCPKYAVDQGLVIDCILDAGHDEPCNPGEIDWSKARGGSMPAASDVDDLPFIDSRPAIDRGTCYHDTHIDHGGRRLGLLFTDDRQTSAALLPCPYLGRAGL